MFQIILQTFNNIKQINIIYLLYLYTNFQPINNKENNVKKFIQIYQPNLLQIKKYNYHKM